MFEEIGNLANSAKLTEAMGIKASDISNIMSDATGNSNKLFKNLSKELSGAIGDVLGNGFPDLQIDDLFGGMDELADELAKPEKK